MSAEFRMHVCRTFFKYHVPRSVLKTEAGAKWFIDLCMDTFAQLSRRRLAHHPSAKL